MKTAFSDLHRFAPYVLIMPSLFYLAAAASADEVRLKNGGHLIGIALEGDSHVTVDLPNGTIVLPKAEVEAIVPGHTLLHEYEERYAEAKEKGIAAAYLDLAHWARRSGITRDSETLPRLALRVEPGNTEAHCLLGQVWSQGRWTSVQNSAAARQVHECREAVLQAAVKAPEHAHGRTARATEGVPYAFGFPRYDTNRGSHVWGTGWYSTFGTQFWMTPYFSRLKGFVPPLPRVPDSGRAVRRDHRVHPRTVEPRKGGT